MYTVKIDISDWGSDESVTIETSDFDKVQIIQEFVEFQREYGWCADYELLVGDDEEEIEEEIEEEDEPSTISTYVITKIEE
jgi:hypothetical protein